jgi:hypothetical protein
MCRDSGLAVDRLGENPRERGLADSTRSRKEICVVQALRLERIHQRGDDVRLAHDLLEDPGTPLAR